MSTDRIRDAKVEFYSSTQAGEKYREFNDATPERKLRDRFEQRVISRLASGKLLDAGAGYGRLSVPLARQGLAVTALDSSAGMLEELRRQAGELNVTTIEGEVEHLPFEDATFDTVISMRVLIHLPGCENIIAEYLRVLKPEGRLIFDMQSDHVNAVRRMLGKKPLSSGQHEDPLKFSNKFSIPELKELLARHGARLEKRYSFALSRSLFLRNRVITEQAVNKALANPIIGGIYEWLESALTHVLPSSWAPYYIAVVRKN